MRQFIRPNIKRYERPSQRFNEKRQSSATTKWPQSKKIPLIIKIIGLRMRLSKSWRNTRSSSDPTTIGTTPTRPRRRAFTA
jgi:hypothetical protein